MILQSKRLTTPKVAAQHCKILVKSPKSQCRIVRCLVSCIILSLQASTLAVALAGTMRFPYAKLWLVLCNVVVIIVVVEVGTLW